MDEKWIPFNLNSSIKVRLTGLGYQRLADIYNEMTKKLSLHTYMSASFYKNKSDENGYTEFQAWDFIRKFGDVTVHGGPEYYEMDILIKTE